MKKQYKSIIHDLVQDPLFAQNEKYSELLLYLEECAETDYIPTETDIAKRILGRSDRFDPTTDASVRVLVSKLRKKLNDYYGQKGKHDKVRLNIPKRQYTLKFVERQSVGQFANKQLIFAVSGLFFVMFAAIVLLGIRNHQMRQFFPHNTKPAKDHFLWGDFVKNNKPSILAIGHVFTYCEYQDSINCFRIVRNRLVNSESDLKKYMAEYNIPEQNIWLPNWDPVPKYSVKYFNLLQSIYPRWFKSLTMETSTKLAWSDFINNNIIYVGHYHNLGKLNQFYHSSHFYSPSQNNDYDYLVDKLRQNHPDRVNISANPVQAALKNQFETLFNLQHRTDNSDSIVTVYNFEYDKDSNYVKDYVILSKLPGPNTSHILFIISFHQIGRLRVIDMLADSEKMETFKDQIRIHSPELPQYFEALVEVNGYKETAMNTRILHFYPIESNFGFN